MSRRSPLATVGSDRLVAGFLALDLEVGRKDRRIHAFAAVHNAQTLTHSGGLSASALAKLDAFAADASYLVGHNLIAFDLPHLQAAKPDLGLIQLPAIDTLWLNPLAFPRNPYHHLVKHYQDGQLKRERVNDPELDARLSLELLGDQRKALREVEPDLLIAWHWLTTNMGSQRDEAAQPLRLTSTGAAGFHAFFATLRGAPRPTAAAARTAIRERLAQTACHHQGRQILAGLAQQGWPLAYALAWLSVAGGNSVMPPWVWHQFPEAGRLVRRLRDVACTDRTCR